MPINLSANIFGLIPEFANNENNRPGILLLEYFQANVTTSSDTGDAEVPTQLDDCLGLISLNYNDEFAGADYDISLATDGIITTGAVTVRLTLPAGGTDGVHVVRGFFVGTKRSQTVLINTPA